MFSNKISHDVLILKKYNNAKKTALWSKITMQLLKQKCILPNGKLKTNDQNYKQNKNPQKNNYKRDIFFNWN